MSGRVVLIASYPKSGNTWLRAFLTSVWRDGDDVDLNRLLIPSISSRRLIDPLIGISSSDLSADEVLQLRGAMLESAAQRVGENMKVFLKTHDANVMNSEDLSPCFAHECIERVVYLVRDPRDVASSLARHLDTSVDGAIAIMGDSEYRLSSYPYRPGYQVPQLLSTWSRHVESWCKLGFARIPLRVVRYEDMVSSPGSVFADILGFLGIRCSGSKLTSAIEGTKISVLQQKELARGFSEKPPGNHKFFHGGRVNDWQRCLSESQVKRIESDHHEVMAGLGYELHG